MECVNQILVHVIVVFEFIITVSLSLLDLIQIDDGISQERFQLEPLL